MEENLEEQKKTQKKVVFLCTNNEKHILDKDKTEILLGLIEKKDGENYYLVPSEGFLKENEEENFITKNEKYCLVDALPIGDKGWAVSLSRTFVIFDGEKFIEDPDANNSDFINIT